MRSARVCEDDDVSDPSHTEPTVHHFRYDATGLRGKRMRLMDDMPSSDAGHVQHALIGVTDVIVLTTPQM
jgi:hypothetical protein